MPLICPHCGSYTLLDTEHNPNAAPCSSCHQDRLVHILPLFVVTGASGSGKTTAIPALRRRLPDCVVFDKDALWAHSLREHTNNWLRVAFNVAQGGRHSIICGTIVPEHFKGCEARDMVSTIHFLNLHCDDDTRERRLRERPSWRRVDDALIDEHRRFAHQQLQTAATAYDPPMPTIDTSRASVDEVADAIGRWVEHILAGRLTMPPVFVATPE